MDFSEQNNFEIINVITQDPVFTITLPTNLPSLNLTGSIHKHFHIDICDLVMRTGDDIPIFYLQCSNCNVCYNQFGHSNNICSVITPEIRINDLNNGSAQPLQLPSQNNQYKQTLYKSKQRISFVVEKHQQNLQFVLSVPSMFQNQNIPLYDSIGNLNLSTYITGNTIPNQQTFNLGQPQYLYNNFILAFNIQFLVQ